MEDWQGDESFASYSSSINNENSGYELHLGSFTNGHVGVDHRKDQAL